jgi:hypothetical protein
MVNYLSPTMKTNLINPNTYEGEFYQEEGLTGSFVIDLTTPIAMEVDNELVDTTTMKMRCMIQWTYKCLSEWASNIKKT